MCWAHCQKNFRLKIKTFIFNISRDKQISPKTFRRTFGFFQQLCQEKELQSSNLAFNAQKTISIFFYKTVKQTNTKVLRVMLKNHWNFLNRIRLAAIYSCFYICIMDFQLLGQRINYKKKISDIFLKQQPDKRKFGMIDQLYY